MQNEDLYAWGNFTRVNGTPANLIALRRNNQWQSAFGGTYFGLLSQISNVLQVNAYGTFFNIVVGTNNSIVTSATASVNANITVGNLFAFVQGTSPSTSGEIIRQVTSPLLPTNTVNDVLIDSPLVQGSTTTFQMYLALN